MTFCLGMCVQDGLVGLADTRVTSGTECITARKVSIFQQPRHSLFVMTSGLRSVRDKVMTYYTEVMEERTEPYDRLFKAVNGFAEQIRRVAAEDKAALTESGFEFNMYALVGGQMAGDREHKLYMVYPQGNWVEVGEGTPYCILGETSYGKPVLDRTLKYHDAMRFALKVGCLAFDSTRISAADVDFPLDVVLYRRDSFEVVTHRLEKTDLQESTAWWQDRLRHSVRELPSNWIDQVFPWLGGQTPSGRSPAHMASDL